MHADHASASEFSSIVSDGPTEASSYQAALFHLREGLQSPTNLSLSEPVRTPTNSKRMRICWRSRRRCSSSVPPIIT